VSLPVEQLLNCAKAAARAAGDHAMASRHRCHEVAEMQQHDIKLILDSECQRKAEAAVHAVYPDHAIMGEEGDLAGGKDAPVWIVDPIDGTVNYFHSLPYWCSAVAVQVDGRTVAGVVYAPVLQEMFYAVAEGGAFCNDRPIRVSPAAKLSESIFMTGLTKSVELHVPSLRIIQTLSSRVQKIRMMGAAALDLCMVARGAAEGLFESGAYLWDSAAGQLIAEQAGGRFEVLSELTGNRRRYLCTNGRIHEELKGAILPLL
jgi:myo-inositol-1(or 4)-monophosphatase